MKGINSIVGGDIDASAGDNARIEASRVVHQFVRATAIVNHGPGVGIITTQYLSVRVACAEGPHDHVVRAIGGRHEGRRAPGRAHSPSGRYCGWIRGRDPESGQSVACGTKCHISACSGSVSGSGLDVGGADDP